MMKTRGKRILLVHQNFPGQFKHLYPVLARHHEVLGLSINPYTPTAPIRLVRYKPQRGSTAKVHPWVSDLETKVIRGEAAHRAMLEIKDQGFVPDLVFAHPGWGEALFIREVWPETRLALYCEFYYHLQGADVNFDPEFSQPDVGQGPRLRMKNANMRLHMDIADAGLAPTRWQASVYPEPFRSRIQVIHDGVDTQQIAPKPDVSLTLGRAGRISRQDEIITFVNRNLEPMRGYHQFMRALPTLMSLRPKARILIVGSDDVSYGARPPEGQTWKQLFLNEVKDRIDMERIHFLGSIPRDLFTQLLQVSRVHVYLTYPFVLSWSLIEAMSAGCAVVASNTAPLKEVIEHDGNGLLVDFFDPEGLAQAVACLSADEQRRNRLGQAARQTAIDHYDLQTVCLPRQLAWLDGLLGAQPAKPPSPSSQPLKN
jgi:glycosyltransferase involved in cell wall biosynthesis